MKIPSIKPWESAIAVLHDNILGEEVSGWEKTFTHLREDLEAVMPHPVAKERRTAPRFHLSLPVSHRIKNLQTSWEETKSLDISQNGIRLAMDCEIPVGTHLELDMKLPNEKKTVRLKGVVVWGKPSPNGGGQSFECGVAFENFRNNESLKGKLIQFMADRLCKLAMEGSGDLTCRPAETKEDLLKAYELVYQEYQARNICPENSARMHYSFFCMMPGSRTFVLEMNQKIVGTISLLVDSPCGIPMETIFPKEIASFRKSNRLIAEVSLLALDQEVFGRKSFSLTDLKKLMGSFKLFKIMFDYARFVPGVTDIFIAMHPKHRDLYQYLTFESIGPVRSYYRAEGKPALPMHLDVGRTILTLPRELSIQRYFIQESLPQELLESYFEWDADHVHEFLYLFRPLWQDLTAQQRAYLQNIYPGLDINL